MGFFAFLVLIVVVVVVVLNVRKTRRIEEFKNSVDYAFALVIIESLEKTGKGCEFGEPRISYYDGDADARWSSIIYIPSKENFSHLTIQTVLSSVTRSVMESNIISNGYCVLDMGPLCIEIMSGKSFYDKSQEMIDFLKWIATQDSAGSSNLYCNGKLIASYINGKPSDTPSDSLPNRLQY
jgi:hypothetical protein